MTPRLKVRDGKESRAPVPTSATRRFLKDPFYDVGVFTSLRPSDTKSPKTVHTKTFCVKERTGRLFVVDLYYESGPSLPSQKVQSYLEVLVSSTERHFPVDVRD